MKFNCRRAVKTAKMALTLHLGLPEPHSLEEVKEGEDISGMRLAILRGARQSRLIRDCLEIAELRLLNREEIYVLLACKSLLKLEELYQCQRDLTTPQHRAPETAAAALDGH
jgi:hypothetical protein